MKDRLITDLLYKDEKYALIQGADSMTLIYFNDKAQVFALISYGNDIFIRDESGNTADFRGLHLPYVIEDIRNGAEKIKYWEGELTVKQFCKLMIDTYKKEVKVK